MENSVIELKAETEEFSVFLDELLSNVSNVSHEVRKFVVHFIGLTTELISIESRVTSGTTVAALFKPTQRLIDLNAALRACNVELVAVKNPHLDEPLSKIVVSNDGKDYNITCDKAIQQALNNALKDRI